MGREHHRKRDFRSPTVEEAGDQDDGLGRNPPDGGPLTGSAVPSRVVDFVNPTPPAPIELHDAVTSSAAEVVRLADSAVHYLHGLPDLRQWIAEWYTARGLPTDRTR